MSAESTPLLVIGHDGMVGRAVHHLVRTRGTIHRCVTWPELDLSRRDAIERLIGDDLKVVVNCGAWTDVDGAEDREEEAMTVNGVGVGDLADRCRRIGAVLVHFSTDYVFSGEADAPYQVDDARAPLNAYGRTKARGEELIEASGCEHLIVRTSWVYATWGKNFVRTIARLAAERDKIRVIDDQRGRPTSAEHLASTTIAVLEAGGRGIFHVADGGECTWYQLARAVVDGLGLSCRVEPCSTAEFPRPARRPAYSTLDLSKTETLLGVAMPDWRLNLSGVLERLDISRATSES